MDYRSYLQRDKLRSWNIHTADVIKTEFANLRWIYPPLTYMCLMVRLCTITYAHLAPKEHSFWLVICHFQVVEPLYCNIRYWVGMFSCVVVLFAMLR